MKKLDLKDEQTIAVGIAACTGVTVVILALDWWLTNTLLTRAADLDNKIRTVDNALSALTRSSWFSDISARHGSDPVAGATRMETGTGQGMDPTGQRPAPLTGDTVNHSHTRPGIADLEIQAHRGGVESE